MRLMAHFPFLVGNETAGTGSPRMACATTSGQSQAARAASAGSVTPPARHRAICSSSAEPAT